MKKPTKPILEKPCDYNYSNCTKIATAQHILKLGVVTIQKNWICDNCYQQLQEERNH